MNNGLLHRVKLTLQCLFTFGIFLVLQSCSENKKLESDYQWPIIAGFPKPQVPQDNPMTQAKVNLGKQLFFDKSLSANQQQACASCHHQEFSFGENIPHSFGSTAQPHRRNASALVNIAYNKTLTWAHDGLTSIEQQILLPMFGESPVELGITGHEDQVLARFNTKSYQRLFTEAFPEKTISFDLIVKALASYVRSLISLDSPFDSYAYLANDNAISAEALRGMNLFFSERLECHHCHGGFNFTQSTSHEKQLIDRRPFHNTGLYNVSNSHKSGYPKNDTGLAEISTLARDDGRFRAPTLRNIEVSAPYMHDGSMANLSDVIDFYAAGGRNITTGKHQGDGRKNPLKSQFIKGFTLTTAEKNDLLAFLKTLTDQTFLSDPKHIIVDK
ncbi:MbnH family di-heme enzyme [Colwellia sp. MB02u-14]|uniref:MbnH family di-heme enzyme n=1 Tax=Colwellia sp. MB02u-14 TaxID=2759815 RepID=UPI0015F4413C|nr:MbnH family di-heme enzyme [Colwellia sp. MB02u-14]MBA6304090.1 di-heme enzyme [Colwellia sp. MB02u-14]